MFLHVTGRRADGYHVLQTLFQFLNHGDDIEFSVHSDSKIQRIDQHHYALPDNDLCVRAAQLLREAADLPQAGATIVLQKKIPPGSGLGAGSSNAATTLMVLNQLWETGFSTRQLMEIGRQLGADVPIFIYGKSAWAEGIGDQLSPVEPATGWHSVIIPNAHVNTAQMFSSPHLRRDHKPVSYKDFLEDNTSNDLEAITTAHHPEVSKALDHLNQFGDAKMSWHRFRGICRHGQSTTGGRQHQGVT